MATAESEMSWWWAAAGLVTVAVAVAISTSAPTAFGRKGQRHPKKQEEDPPKDDDDSDTFSKRERDILQKIPCSLEQEPWCPKMETKDWQDASQLPGCPWNFDSCESLQDVFDRIWRKPLPDHLQKALTALQGRVKNIQVAKVSVTMPNALHFAIIYTLNTGAELFGGAPLEHAVGLELGEEKEEAVSPLNREGLRQRKGSLSPVRRKESEAVEIMLPCLLPFYRVHDGFGVLLSTRHLPVVLGSPTESINGSCFYVYPARGLEPVNVRESLVKFARVDRSCCACADSSNPQPCVVYVEKNGEAVDDDEPPLSFIADTVSNVAGQRVVPPSYLGGPSPFGR